MKTKENQNSEKLEKAMELNVSVLPQTQTQIQTQNQGNATATAVTAAVTASQTTACVSSEKSIPVIRIPIPDTPERTQNSIEQQQSIVSKIPTITVIDGPQSPHTTTVTNTNTNTNENTSNMTDQQQQQQQQQQAQEQSKSVSISPLRNMAMNQQPPLKKKSGITKINVVHSPKTSPVISTQQQRQSQQVTPSTVNTTAVNTTTGVQSVRVKSMTNSSNQNTNRNTNTNANASNKSNQLSPLPGNGPLLSQTSSSGRQSTPGGVGTVSGRADGAGSAGVTDSVLGVSKSIGSSTVSQEQQQTQTQQQQSKTTKPVVSNSWANLAKGSVCWTFFLFLCHICVICVFKKT